MPKQTRWLIKQELDGAIGNLDWALDKVLRVAKPFEHVHDDWFDKFIKVAATIKVTQEIIKQLREDI